MNSISSLLRLSAKYGIGSLRCEIIVALHRLFPLSLDKWDEVYSPYPPEGYPGYYTSPLGQDWRLVEYLYLCLDHDLAFFVPAVALRLCQVYPPLVLLTRVTRIDAMALIMKGRIQALDALEPYLHQWLNENSACEDENQCKNARLRFLKSASRHSGSLQCLVPYEVLLNQVDNSWSVCGNCIDDFRDMYQQGRGDYWDRVPSFFGSASDECETLQNRLGQGLFTFLS